MKQESYSDRIDAYFQEKAKAAQAYFEITNQLLGVLAFSLAIGCLGTRNPPLFASISCVLVALVWGHSIKRVRSDLDELKYVEHESVSFTNIMKNTYLAVASFLFLALIVIQVVTPSGVVL